MSNVVIQKYGSILSYIVPSLGEYKFIVPYCTVHCTVAPPTCDSLRGDEILSVILFSELTRSFGNS
jgi:hypothetical protein